jgi:DNA-binding transcriptional LysR family regulator
VSHIFSLEEHLNADALYDEPMYVVAGTQNPWTRRRKVELADLMNEPWTLPPPDSLIGSIIDETFRAHGLDVPRTAVVTSTIPVRSALLASGRFLTMVPNSTLTFPVENTSLKRLPIDLPTTHGAVAVITLKNRTLSPVAQLFIDCARKVAKSMADRP